jgi:hypothetical protein
MMRNPAGAAARGVALFFVLSFLQSGAMASVVVTGSLTHEFTVVPGRVYSGSIEVSNPEDRPQELKAYQTDFTFNSEGSTVYGEPGSIARSNAPWISLSPRLLTLPAHGAASISFNVSVPADQTLTGTYWSIIMVEPIDAGSAESGLGDAKDPGLGIKESLRYGVQIVTTVKDSGSRNLKFEKISMKSEGGKSALVVDASASGELWLRATAWAELYDSKGALVGRFEGGRKRIFPGTSVRFSIDLSGAPKGSYKALIVADCENDDIFGVNVKFDIKG